MTTKGHTKNKQTKEDDIQGIFSALHFLSAEAERAGLSEIGQIIKTAQMASDDWLKGTVPTQKEVNLIYLLKEFYFAPKIIKEKTLEVISTLNNSQNSKAI